MSENQKNEVVDIDDIKEIVVVIHPNESIRTFALTKFIPIKNENGWYDYNIRKPEDVHPDLAPMISEILSKPYIDHVDIQKTEIRIECTEAYSDRWDQFSDRIAQIINMYVFDGEAHVKVRDDRPKYERANRDEAFY